MPDTPKTTRRTESRETEARGPAARRTRTTAVRPHAAIAERAYLIALERGGDPLQNWLEAERELSA